MTDKFIEKVKLHGILYDSDHPDFKDWRKKDKVWEEIGLAFESDGNHMKKKWKNIRDCYVRYLKSERTHPNDRTRMLENYRNWPWAEHMEEIKPFLKGTENDSKLFKNNYFQVVDLNKFKDEESEILEIGEDVDNSVDTQSYIPLKSERKRKKNQETSGEQTPVFNVLSYVDDQEKRTTAEYDDVELICLGYARTIKKFSARRQTMVKFKIAKILMEEELAQLTEGNFPTNNQTASPS